MPDPEPSQCDDRSSSPTHKPADHLNGASIIDEDGRELPITEEMIQRALDEAHRRWQSSGSRQPEPAES
jgi:hypothetical protein